MTKARRLEELQQTYSLADDAQRSINGLIACPRTSQPGGEQVREAAA